MLFDVAAWAAVILLAFVVGTGVLTVLGAEHLRPGDRFILGTWVGIVILTLTLLAVSLFAPLHPPLSLAVGILLSGIASVALTRLRVELRDEGVVNERALTAAGTAGVWRVSPGVLHLIVGDDAEALASALGGGVGAGR